MPDFGKLQKEPLWRAYCVIPMAFLCESAFVVQGIIYSGCSGGHGLSDLPWYSRILVWILIQDISQWFKWNLTFVNVKYIPSNKWSLFLLLMLKIFVTLDIFNCCKRGHSDTVRLHKEKQRSAWTLHGSLFINGWTYATQCSIQQMTM